jgi:hypothetical protein
VYGQGFVTGLVEGLVTVPMVTKVEFEVAVPVFVPAAAAVFGITWPVVPRMGPMTALKVAVAEVAPAMFPRPKDTVLPLKVHGVEHEVVTNDWPPCSVSLTATAVAVVVPELVTVIWY